MSLIEKIKELRSADKLDFEKRVELKKHGRPLPDLEIKQTSKDKNKEVHRNFRRSLYDLADWICGCDVSNAFYCFVCIMFPNDSSWCTTGITDLKHLKEKIRKHSRSAEHIKSSMNYSIIGNVDIRLQLNNDYRQSVTEFNENVSKNRYILNKIIDCIKFCGAFELALRGHSETDSSKNAGIFLGLVDFVAELDPIFKQYLERATVFEGTSKSVQNDLLDSMLAVAQGRIKEEIHLADYVAIQVDEMTDSFSKMRMIFIIRYVLSGVVHERFLKFVNPPGIKTEQLTNAILQELEILEINKKPEKLIGLSFDAASTMSGRLGGLQKKIKDHYPTANFIHCYAHELNMIVQKVASQDKNVKVFFASLHAFSTFFSRSPKCMAVLDEIIKVRLPKGSPTTWNFNTRCIETVSTYKNDISYCLEKIIETEEDSHIVSQALALKAVLENEDFLFWLNFFHLVMPYCDILFDQLHQHNIDVASVKNCMDSFKTTIETIRGKVLNELCLEDPLCTTNDRKRQRTSEESNHRVALEVCDIIMSEMSHRFSFSDHLIISELFNNDRFATYQITFPENILNLVKKDFPFINHFQLKTELQIIYDRDDFHESSGAVAILQLFYNNNLNETFSETVKLLTILCTLPMATVESDRCFSTLKRVKSFLGSTIDREKLSALSMLSIEKSLICSITNYNERVINHFADSKVRSMALKFKSI